VPSFLCNACSTQFPESAAAPDAISTSATGQAAAPIWCATLKPRTACSKPWPTANARSPSGCRFPRRAGHPRPADPCQGDPVAAHANLGGEAPKDSARERSDHALAGEFPLPGLAKHEEDEHRVEEILAGCHAPMIRGRRRRSIGAGVAPRLILTSTREWAEARSASVT
jgi:hypothetical protein